ncbi:unnamed protein product [Amoebophrya sp. A120]|nr:unnamed protein product [Amoebophrya sp. A120]|eukprot:GSA120T00012535001.1
MQMVRQISLLLAGVVHHTFPDVLSRGVFFGVLLSPTLVYALTVNRIGKRDDSRAQKLQDDLSSCCGDVLEMPEPIASAEANVTGRATLDNMLTVSDSVMANKPSNALSFDPAKEAEFLGKMEDPVHILLQSRSLTIKHDLADALVVISKAMGDTSYGRHQAIGRHLKTQQRLRGRVA